MKKGYFLLYHESSMKDAEPTTNIWSNVCFKSFIPKKMKDEC